MEKYFKKDESRQTSKRNAETAENSENRLCSTQQESPPTKLKKSYKYLKCWEEDPLLKPWLKCHNSLPYCQICSCGLKGGGGINDLKQYAKSAKHMSNSKAFNLHHASSKLFAGISSANQAITKAQLKLSAFCAEHNISFATMDHLIPVLKNAIPDSEIVKHLSCARTKSTALVKNVIGVNHACKQLPKFVESCVRDIYNFVQTSSKRIELYSSLQILLDYKPNKLLHPWQTRWLSLEATVVQILSRFEVLRLFFIHEDIEKFDAVQWINICFQNKQFELYLKFLKFILNDINRHNRLFQSESPQLHLLYHQISRLYLKIFEYFVKEEFINLECLKEINLNNIILKELPEIYLGADVNTALTTTHLLSSNDEADFRFHCQQFYIELCNHLMKKFDFGDKLLQALEILAPINIINKKNLSCTKLLVFFPNIINRDDFQNVDDEWREIRLLNFLELGLDENVEVDIFWYQLLDLKRSDGSLCFLYLKRAVMAILTIPVATANVERTFSQINLNKTKIRNCLDPSTLTGILLSKDYIKKNYKDCTNFEPSKAMINKFNAGMYKSAF